MSENLPANQLSEFTKGAQQYRRPQSRAESGFLRFKGTTGDWFMGQEETPVYGEEVLIASHTMEHGYIRWGEMPPAKAFAKINQPYPEKPEPVEGTDYEGRPKTFFAEEARQIVGKFIDDNLGQFIFNTSSMGGVENLDELFDEILLKAQDGGEFVYPLITLENEWYKRSTGKVFKPVFKIKHWCNANGEVENAKLEKKAKAKQAEVEEADVEEAEEEQAPPRRRRRRA